MFYFKILIEQHYHLHIYDKNKSRWQAISRKTRPSVGRDYPAEYGVNFFSKDITSRNLYQQQWTWYV